MVKNALSPYYTDDTKQASEKALEAILNSGLMAIETVLRSDKSPYDGQDAQVIYMYVKA